MKLWYDVNHVPLLTVGRFSWANWTQTPVWISDVHLIASPKHQTWVQAWLVRAWASSGLGGGLFAILLPPCSTSDLASS